MRRVLIAIGVVLLLLVAAVVAVPLLFKDRIVAAVAKEIEGKVDADVSLGETSLSLLRAFPHISLGVKDLAVVGHAPFLGVELARVGEARATLDLRSVIGGGPIEVRAVSLENPHVHIIVDEQGRTNTDITAADEEAAAAEASDAATQAMSLRLRDASIENLVLTYEDREAGTELRVNDLDFQGDADVDDVTLAMKADASIASLTYEDGGVKLLRNARTQAHLHFVYTFDSGKVELEPSSVKVNDLSVGFSGRVEPKGDDTDLDLAFQAEQTTFKSLLSLIPSAYTADFADVKADGSLALGGKVRGIMPAEGDDLPGLDLELLVKDASFRFPDLPVGVDGIQLDVIVKHPGGPLDDMAIDVNRFHLLVDGSPLDGKLSLRHLDTDPEIALLAKGKVDLGKLREALPPDGITYTGTMDVDLDIAGALSDFESGDVDRVKAGGTFALRDVIYTDPEEPLPFHIVQLDLSVEPKKVDMATFQLLFGRSDLQATGSVDNALGYLLNDQVLVGRFDARSKMLDLNPWSDDGETAAAAGATNAESSIATVPTDLDLVLGIDFDRVLYEEYDLANLRGSARVKDGVMTLDRVRATTLGGEVELNGTYAAPTDREAKVDMTVTVTDLVIGNAVDTFDSLAKIAPIAKGSKGRLRSSFGVKTHLGPDLSPELETLFSSGDMKTLDFTVQPGFMGAVASKLGNDKFKGLDLDGANFAFLIEGGQLKLDEVPFTVAGAKGKLFGKTGVIDETLDLTMAMDVPIGAIKAGDLVKAIGGAKGTVPVAVKVGGTFKDPKVRVDVSDLTDTLVETAKDELKGALEDKLGTSVEDLVAAAMAKGDALVAEAEKAADKLRQEAESAGDALRDEAKKAGKKLKKEAKGNPIKEAAAEKAAQSLEDEADKKAKALEKEADKKADALVAKAEGERDDLVAKAKAK